MTLALNPAGPGNPLATLHRRQPTLAVAGWVFLAGLAVCLVLMQIDQRQLIGVNVWSKPAKFFASAAVYLWTVGWFFAALPPTWRTGWRGAVLVWGPITSMVVELTLISFQAARGVASHFNTAAPMDGMIYSIMGLFAVLSVVYVAMMGWAILRHGRGQVAPLYCWAILAGIAVFILGGVEGMMMANNPTGHWIEASRTDANGLPIVLWSRDGGDLRVAHFFGLHGLQILPLYGWLLMRFKIAGAGWWLAGGTATYTAIFAATWIGALNGVPLI